MNMKKLVFIALLSLAMAPAMAQHGGHNCGNCPHHKQHQQAAACCDQQKQQPKTINGMAAEIVQAFPEAKSVKKETKWTVVLDANKKVMGYAVYSKPASDGIKGYNGETPLMVALDAKQKVKCVILLPNNETPAYLQRVTDAGLLKAWDGMKASKACKKKVDTVSGATFSSRSIIQTLQAALKNI